jgi:hypothetical protein
MDSFRQEIRWLLKAGLGLSLSFSIRGFNRDKRIIKEKALILLIVKAFSRFEIRSFLEVFTLGSRDIFRKAKLWRGTP